MASKKVGVCKRRHKVCWGVRLTDKSGILSTLLRMFSCITAHLARRKVLMNLTFRKVLREKPHECTQEGLRRRRNVGSRNHQREITILTRSGDPALTLAAAQSIVVLRSRGVICDNFWFYRQHSCALYKTHKYLGNLLSRKILYRKASSRGKGHFA